MDKRILTILILIIGLTQMSLAQSESEPDESVRKTGFFNRIVDYFSRSNQPDTIHKFDISFIGGPFYTKESSVGIGLVAAGIYKKDPRDIEKINGQVNLYGKISVKGFFKVGIEGTQYFGNKSGQLLYDLSFEYARDKFWGIGYAMDSNKDNESDYRRRNAQVNLTYLNAVSPNIFLGPYIFVDYLSTSHYTKPWLWEGQKKDIFTDQIGVKFELDTRDYKYNAYRGMFASIRQGFSPKFLGNRRSFYLTDMDFRYYFAPWSSGILALNLNTRWTFGNPPWNMMSKIGNSYSMRGYWEGQYIDKCSSYAILELRQHIWHRIGMVVWAGIGEIYSKPSKIFSGEPLPNYGLGYRWEFKKRVNVRVDCGFGKDQWGVVFNVNEAF